MDTLYENNKPADDTVVSLGGIWGKPTFHMHSALAGFLDNVNRLTSVGRMPRADDLDLMKMYRDAPDITLLDIEPGSRRFIMRFVGTRVVNFYGREITGCYLDEVDMGPHRSKQMAAVNMAAAFRMPQWTRVGMTISDDFRRMYPEQRHIAYERLVLPLTNEQGEVIQLASMLKCYEVDDEVTEFEHREVPFCHSVKDNINETLARPA